MLFEKNLAQITSIKQTWKPDNSYKELIDHIMNIPQEEAIIQKGDFEFIINDNTVYIQLEDFKNTEARNLYEKAQEARKNLNSTEQSVNDLRRRYENEKEKRESLAKDIITLENKLKSLYGEAEKYETEARNAEIKSLNKK